MRTIAILVALLSFAAGARGQDEKQRAKVVVPGADTLEVEFPKDWQVKTIQPSPELPPTLRVYPPNPSEMSLQITFMHDKEGKFSTADDIKKVVGQVNARYVRGSVEKKADLIAVESKSVKGYFSTFTDASLMDVKPIPPGQYLKASSGIIVVGRSIAAFTLLFNEGGAAHQRAALECIGKIQKK